MDYIDYDGLKCYLYKNNPTDKIWRAHVLRAKGLHLFSFDGKKLYNMFRDYPHNLTKEQKELFDKENPFWADFFKDRQ